jgi:outer membrane lipoprotein-sorting protein
MSMSPSTQQSRRLRWAVPVGAVAVTGGVLAASLVSAAQATPTLPARTPAQLLAAVAGRTGPLPPMTGTVVETAALGLPDLPALGDPTSIQSLVTGSHTIRVWYSDPQHLRLAIPGQLSETDVIRNGRDVWLWSSVRNTATHLRLPAAGGKTPEAAPPQPPLTPQQAAQQVLAAVGPTTSVSVASNVMVAGEPSYELVLAPKDSRSLVGQVRIAIDAHHNLPLRVQVFPRGAATPAFQTGFTSIAFTQPAAANFAFTPPVGARVVQENGPAALHAGAVPPAAVRLMPGGAVKMVPGSPIKVIRGARIKLVPGGAVKVMPNGTVVRVMPDGTVVRVMPDGTVVKMMPGSPIKVVRGPHGQLVPGPAAVAIRSPAGVMIGGAGAYAGHGTVVGQGWLAVAVLPAGAALANGGPPAAPGAAFGPALGALLRAASPVSGAWGSGQLLRTSLLSVLLTNDGRLLIGAVTPDVLYSAAAKTSHLAGR